MKRRFEAYSLPASQVFFEDREVGRRKNTSTAGSILGFSPPVNNPPVNNRLLDVQHRVRVSFPSLCFSAVSLPIMLQVLSKRVSSEFLFQETSAY